MRLSYADIFQHNTSYQARSYLFRNMIRILKVESETICQGDEKRLVSRKNYFTPKPSWSNVMVGGLSRATMLEASKC